MALRVVDCGTDFFLSSTSSLLNVSTTPCGIESRRLRVLKKKKEFSLRRPQKIESVFFLLFARSLCDDFTCYANTHTLDTFFWRAERAIKRATRWKKTKVGHLWAHKWGGKRQVWMEIKAKFDKQIKSHQMKRFLLYAPKSWAREMRRANNRKFTQRLFSKQ